MKIENTEVFGFKAAFRALRNPKDSWNLSDSESGNFSKHNTLNKNYNIEGFILGEKDLELSVRLMKAGTEHCKHLRMIQVWADLTLPRYIWQEFDTYKHVEKVSCSTMHKLMTYDLDHDMFEGGEGDLDLDEIDNLRVLINEYKDQKDPIIKKRLKLKVKRKLPESFLQKRTINTNYQQLANIYFQRKNHELPEWYKNNNSICKWIENLPYFKELCLFVEKGDYNE
jgi:hypothetical protein